LTDIAQSPAAAGASPVRVISDGYRQYAMWMLLIVYILNFVDRTVVNILAEPIKNELGLLDWQIGAMSGLAFALFYTILGLPIARLADKGNRPRIIGVALAVWSGFTVLCGFAQNFTHLVLARIGVGIGEAGCTPPAHSLITDYVPKEKRASALAFYHMGTPLGSLVGMVLGGVVADAYGWRAAFIICGLPGLALAVLVLLTLIEPRAKRLASELKAAAPTVTFNDVLKVLMTKRTFWLVSMAAAIKAFIGYGHAPFTASFFFRNHAEEIKALADSFGLGVTGFMGIALGVVGGIAGALGSWIGGYVADRYAMKDVRAYMIMPAIAVLLAVPIYIVAINMPSAVGAMALLTINALLGALWYGPVYATPQSIVPPHMRATASAILLFIINLIGLGLGPLLVGILSDLFAIQGGMGSAEGVRWALMVSALFGIVSGWFFWTARKTIREEMEG
jgi:MFS family permease